MQLIRADYIVCDPCYVMTDEAYEQLCDLMYPKNWEVTGPVNHLKINGHELWVHSTMYGDGTYCSNSEIDFDVDSGTIGAIPLGLCDPEKVKEIRENKKASLFEAEALLAGYHEGTFIFSGEVSELLIFTEDQEEEQDDYDESYCDNSYEDDED